MTLKSGQVGARGRSIRVRKVNCGLYEMTVGARRFEIKDIGRARYLTGLAPSHRPDWLLVEVTDAGDRHMNRFATMGQGKRAAIEIAGESHDQERGQTR